MLKKKKTIALSVIGLGLALMLTSNQINLTNAEELINSSFPAKLNEENIVHEVPEETIQSSYEEYESSIVSEEISEEESSSEENKKNVDLDEDTGSKPFGAFH